VANDRNGGVRLCPFFEPNAVATAIDNLPDTLAADDSTWTMDYDFDGKPAWLWPHGQIPACDRGSVSLDRAARRAHHDAQSAVGPKLALGAEAMRADHDGNQLGRTNRAQTVARPAT
jgi:hypothetical protein